MTAHRPRLVAAAVLALALAAFPLGTLAIHDFADVPDANPFHADISALASSGVTAGCGGGNFCPSAFVTREQMAAFMNRLGALSPEKTPVVNADKLDGLDSTDLLAAETIVLRQSGGWELQSSDAATTTLQRAGQATLVARSGAGSSTVFLPIVFPAAVGGRGYELASVTVCWDASLNSFVDETEFEDAHSSLNLNEPTFLTDHATTFNGCYSELSPAAFDPLGGILLRLRLTYSAAGDVRLLYVETTWEPAPA